jgi:Flp pilus assembly protein TadG
MARAGRQQQRTDAGSTTVEVAVLLPLMMLLLMVVVQVGLWFHTRSVMVTAANKGLDAARVDGGTASDGERVTRQFLGHAGALRSPAVDARRGAEEASVTVSGRVVSLIFGAPIGITVTAQAPTERVIP